MCIFAEAKSNKAVKSLQCQMKLLKQVLLVNFPKATNYKLINY